jgi:hypothetical protein
MVVENLRGRASLEEVSNWDNILEGCILYPAPLSFFWTP